MTDWTRQENDLIVADYFSMLNDEIVGKAINKSESRRALLSLLNGRSEGSIEWKRGNISAYLIELGLPFVVGYKPAPNKQDSLLDAILDYLRLRKEEMRGDLKKFSDEAKIASGHLEFTKFVEAPPEIKDTSSLKIPSRVRRPFKINYLVREQNNLSLGEKGEELAIAFERWQLAKAGKQNLAEQIRQISLEDDGAGFDILSKNVDGTDKYIEVKTTKLSKESPFFFSKTEYNFSKENASNYYLYRVFKFADSPKMFQAKGCFDDFCKIEAIQFRGSF